MWSEGLSSWYLDIAKIPDMTARSPTRWAVYSSCGSLRGHGISASEALLAGHSVTQVFRWNSEAMLQQLENSRLLTCSRPLHVVCVCVNVGSFLLHLENLFDSLLCSELRWPCNEPSSDGLIQLCPDGAGIPSVTYLIQNYCVQAWMAEVQVLRK